MERGATWVAAALLALGCVQVVVDAVKYAPALESSALADAFRLAPGEKLRRASPPTAVYQDALMSAVPEGALLWGWSSTLPMETMTTFRPLFVTLGARALVVPYPAERIPEVTNRHPGRRAFLADLHPFAPETRKAPRAAPPDPDGSMRWRPLIETADLTLYEARRS